MTQFELKDQIQYKNAVKKSQKALETKFVEVPLPKFAVEDIAGTTMTTDSEAGQAYQQYGNK